METHHKPTMIPLQDIKFRFTRGTGAGGQHKNKTSSCVFAKHKPTGIEVKVDGRDQHKNKRTAIRQLEKQVMEFFLARKAKEKKKRRDEKIHVRDIIRTYDFSRGQVVDHRTKKHASLKDILIKGKLEKLR